MKKFRKLSLILIVAAVALAVIPSAAQAVSEMTVDDPAVLMASDENGMQVTDAEMVILSELECIFNNCVFIALIAMAIILEVLPTLMRRRKEE